MRALLGTFPLLVLASPTPLKIPPPPFPALLTPAPLCFTDGVNGKCPLLACVAVDCVSYGCFSECSEGCGRTGCLVEHESCDEDAGICRCVCGRIEEYRVNV